MLYYIKLLQGGRAHCEDVASTESDSVGGTVLDSTGFEISKPNITKST